MESSYRSLIADLESVGHSYQGDVTVQQVTADIQAAAGKPENRGKYEKLVRLLMCLDIGQNCGDGAPSS